MTTDLKSIDHSEAEIPITSDSWKNLIFLKNGRSYIGLSVFPTAQAAADTLAELLADTHRGMQVTDGPISIKIANTGKRGRGFLKSDFSHAIQIPWR